MLTTETIIIAVGVTGTFWLMVNSLESVLRLAAQYSRYRATRAVAKKRGTTHLVRGDHWQYVAEWRPPRPKTQPGQDPDRTEAMRRHPSSHDPTSEMRIMPMPATTQMPIIDPNVAPMWNPTETVRLHNAQQRRN